MTREKWLTQVNMPRSSLGREMLLAKLRTNFGEQDMLAFMISLGKGSRTLAKPDSQTQTLESVQVPPQWVPEAMDYFVE